MAEPIFSWGSFTLSAILSGAAGYFLRPYIDNRISRGNVKWNEKRQVAEDLILILSEGDSHAYQRNPENMTKISEVAMKLSHYDEKMSESLNKYVIYWSVAAGYYLMEPKIFEVLNSYREFEKKAHLESRKLNKYAKALKQ